MENDCNEESDSDPFEDSNPKVRKSSISIENSEVLFIYLFFSYFTSLNPFNDISIFLDKKGQTRSSLSIS